MNASAPAADEDEQTSSGTEIRRERRLRQTRGVAIAVKISTLGAGIEGIYSLGLHANVRAQVNGFQISHTLNDQGIQYSGKVHFLTEGLLLDYHPFAGHFRMSLGAYHDSNRISLNAQCPASNGGCNVQNLNIQSNPADPGQLSGTLKFNSFAPYFGFGFGNAMMGSPIHFAFDIGALYQGKPKVNLDASGEAMVTDSSNPKNNTALTYDIGTDPNNIVRPQLNTQQDKANNDIKQFKFYPVISFTVGYRFNFF